MLTVQIPGAFFTNPDMPFRVALLDEAGTIVQEGHVTLRSVLGADGNFSFPFDSQRLMNLALNGITLRLDAAKWADDRVG